MDSNAQWRSAAAGFLLLLCACWVGLGFFFNPEQIMHRSDAAIKKGHKLAFSGPE